jgi:hypothetical protein
MKTSSILQPTSTTPTISASTREEPNNHNTMDLYEILDHPLAPFLMLFLLFWLIREATLPFVPYPPLRLNFEDL